MKFQLITLLSVGLCFAVVVSANYDYYPGDNGDGPPDLGEVFQCSRHVQQYQGSGRHQMAALIRQAGPRAACRDSMKATECIQQVLLKDKYNRIPEFIKTNFQVQFDVINYLCVDKINDLENHFECLSNDAIFENLGACLIVNEGQRQCDSRTFMSCVERIPNFSSLCKAGAKELVRDIINKMIEVRPACSDHTIVHSAVMNFLRKK